MQPSLSLSKLSFQPVTPLLRDRYLAVAAKEATESADYSFGNLYLWNDTYHQSIAFLDGRALVRVTIDGAPCYLMPIGTGDIRPALAALFAAAEDEGVPLCLVGVTEAQLAALPPDLLDLFTVEETRDFADYIYDAASLATLAGKRLHAKRNHINAFSAAHPWQIEPLAPAAFAECREILSRWQGNFPNGSEALAISRALDHFSALSLFGAVLRVEGRAVAFTVGEMILPDTLCVHFEKTLPEFRDAYPVINREFVRMMLAAFPAITRVNREDDMGLPNLRKAKLSLRPAYLLRKFCLKAKDLSNFH